MILHRIQIYPTCLLARVNPTSVNMNFTYLDALPSGVDALDDHVQITEQKGSILHNYNSIMNPSVS